MPPPPPRVGEFSVGVEVAGFGERDHVVGGAGEFEDAFCDPLFEGLLFGEGTFFGVSREWGIR
jgi:hypothetical protein